MKPLHTLPITLPMIRRCPSVPASQALGTTDPTDLTTLSREIEDFGRTLKSASDWLNGVRYHDGKHGVDLDRTEGNIVLANPHLGNGSYRKSFGSAVLKTDTNGDIYCQLNEDSGKPELEYIKDSAGETYRAFALGREYHISSDGKALTIIDTKGPK